jgi:uncharacterized protein
MYEFSVRIFRHSLGNLSGLLRKGAAYAEEHHIPPVALLEMRLSPDMFSLSDQVRAVSYHALAAVANLTGERPPEFERGYASLPELLAEITLELRRGRVRLEGRHYLAHFALPNFFFHLTTAYDILRHCGVVLGKGDFLGDLGELAP